LVSVCHIMTFYTDKNHNVCFDHWYHISSYQIQCDTSDNVCLDRKNYRYSMFTDFPKLAEKLLVIRTDRHENLVRPKIILPVRKKSPKKFTVTCIMFSLAFLEWFTLVLAIGHLISPLVFIEVKIIQFSVFSVVQNCICYFFYSVCLEFCCFDDLLL
jgi:hypothetical protein